MDGSKFVINDGILAWFEGPEWDEVALKAFKEAETQILNTAQTYAPWADRTGDARAGLSTQVNEVDGQITLELFHTVDYGLWLETIQNGRFATIMPTLESYAPYAFSKAEAAIRAARRGRS